MNILLRKLLETDGAEDRLMEYVSEGVCPNYFGLDYPECNDSCRKCWRIALSETSQEMLDRCDKVDFVPHRNNYYICKHHDIKAGCVRVVVNYSTSMECESIKYISKEDALKIVEYCRENN